MNERSPIVLPRVARAAAALLVVACAGGARPPAVDPGAHALPSIDLEDRFFVEPRLAAGGRALRFYTDTGGGLFMTAKSATALGLPVEKVDDGEVVTLPPLAPEASIPPPPGGKLPVFDAPEIWDTQIDGMLGQAWFAGRVWTFDYPGRRLLLRDALPAHDAAHAVPVAFRTEGGARVASFPRIQAEIDGATLDLLFDTGATVRLSAEALAALADGRARERATSFIAAVHFDAWRARHPDWRVLEHADANAGGQPMILVPRVRVAGHDATDVWFTRRPDQAFHEFMSQFMDRQVEGALGGSALRQFRVTVDYPRGVAVFERP